MTSLPTPFLQQMQWISRSINPAGSGLRGQQWISAPPVTTSAVFAPGGSSELTDGGDVVTTQPTLYSVDPTLEVTAFDLFIVGSKTFEVDGDPAAGWQSPFTGWTPGTVIQLKEIAGVG